MARKPEITLKLPKKDFTTLKSLLSGGELKVRTVKRINVLLQMHEGLPSPLVAKAACVTPETARAIVAHYKEGGIKRAIYDAPRPGNKPILDEKSGSKIIAMVCSTPPNGRARWTLELIKEHTIKNKIVDKIGKRNYSSVTS